MKIRHILFLLLVLSAIAFMQPLVSFLGGLALLLGVGALIYRDLPPTVQDTVERWILGWLRRARFNPARNSPPGLSPRSLPTTSSETGVPTGRVRRARVKPTGTGPATTTSPPVSDSSDDPPMI